MAIDDNAVNDIQKKLGVVGLSITNPNSFLVKKLKALVINPDYVSDLHLGLLLRFP
jgi:hypothetical protein